MEVLKIFDIRGFYVSFTGCTSTNLSIKTQICVFLVGQQTQQTKKGKNASIVSMEKASALFQTQRHFYGDSASMSGKISPM